MATGKISSPMLSVENLNSNASYNTSVVDTSKSNVLHVRKVGRMVAIGGEFVALTNISQNAAIIATGLPKGITNSVSQFTAMNKTSMAPLQLAVSSNGDLITMYGGDITAGDIVRFGSVYITAS